MGTATSINSSRQRHARKPGTRVGVVAVDFRIEGGGIAHASRLVRRALTELSGIAPPTLALEPSRYSGVSFAERLGFVARLAAAEAAGRLGWPLFMHLNLARAQTVIPLAMRPDYGVFLHDIEGWSAKLLPGASQALAGASLRLANSHFTARRVMEAHPCCGTVVAVPLGLEDEPTTLDSPDRDLLARVGPRSVLIVGRMEALERYKGHDELLECWPRILARVPDAQLVVAGSGSDAGRLREKAEALGIARRVLWAGFVDEATLSALYRAVAVFAMPSRREGFGLVYLEAMRAGLPCIGATDDAAGEIIVDGRTGFVVPQRDLDALAHRISALLSDALLRHLLGETGRARYQEEYTFARFRDRLGSALREPGGPWNADSRPGAFRWLRTS